MDLFLTLLLNGLHASSLSLLVGLGFSFLFFTRKFFDLSYGALISIGGYGALFLKQTISAPLWLSALFGMCLSSVIGLIIGKLIFDPLQTKKTSPLGMLVASLGVMSVCQAVIALLFTSRFQTLTSFAADQTVQLGQVELTQVRIWLLGLASVVFGLVWLLLRKTTFGKTLRAVNDDAVVAKVIGINTQRITDLATLIAGTLAGLVGVLIGMDTGLEPTVGLPLLLKGITASLIGGLQGPVSVLAGALSLGGLEHLAVWNLPGAWKDAIVFGALLIVLKLRSRHSFSTSRL